MFPSLPVFILHDNVTLTWSDDVCKFALGNSLFLGQSCAFFCFSPTSADLFVVIDLPIYCALLPLGLTSSGWVAGTTVATFCFTDILVCAHSCTSVCLFTFPLFFIIHVFSCNLLTMADCDFCAPTLLAHAKICSIVIFSFSSVVSNFIISIIMSLSFS